MSKTEEKSRFKLDRAKVDKDQHMYRIMLSGKVGQKLVFGPRYSLL